MAQDCYAMRCTTFFVSLLCCLFLHGQKPNLVLPTLHTNPVLDMSFSEDGRFLLTTSINEAKLWEASSGKLILTLQGRNNEGYSLAKLSADRQLIVTAGNCFPIGGKGSQAPTLRLWSVATGEEVQILETLPLGYCISYLDISPKGDLLAVALKNDQGTEETRIYNLKNRKLTNRFEHAETGVFTADGKQLIFKTAAAVSSVQVANGKEDILFQGDCLAYRLHNDTLSLLTTAKSLKQITLKNKAVVNEFFTGTAEAGWSFRSSLCRISADGKRLLKVYSQPANSQDPREQIFRFETKDTRSGAVVADTLLQDPQYAQMALSPQLDRLISAPYLKNDDSVFEVAPSLFAYDTKNGALSHDFGLSSLKKTARANFFPPRFEVYNGGEILHIKRSYPNRSSVFLPQKGQLFYIDSEVELLSFAKGAAIVKDERWRITCDDGISYHLEDIAKKEEVAVLLLAEPEDEVATQQSSTWAVSTSSGLFDASPDMMDDLHYATGTEIVGLEQLKERYYEPRLLPKIFGLNEEEIRQAAGLEQLNLYPEVLEAAIDLATMELRVSLQPRDGGIGQVSLFINAKEVDANINRNTKKDFSVDCRPFEAFLLPNQQNTIELRLFDASGWLKSPAIPVSVKGEGLRARGASNAGGATVSLADDPSLYAIVVGTSNYEGEALDLAFADRDANYFSRAISIIAPGLFEEDRVHVHLLNTDEKDSERAGTSSKTAIKRLFDEIATKAKAQDVLMIYFSGHGVNYGTAENTQFYYLTKDVSSENLSDPVVRDGRAISSEELTEWINKIPALKQVMIFDACNAGKIIDDIATSRDLISSQIRALDRMKDRTGMFILTGAAADKASFESNSFGQGLLTYSLLEGMRGLAAFEDERIDISRLFNYARERVPVLAKELRGDQTPLLNMPKGGGSFDIGINDGRAEVPIAVSKPVFVRSNFQEEEGFHDVLSVAAAVATHFNRLNLGGTSPFVYSDISDYPGAFAIKGRYRIEQEKVILTALLYRGDAIRGERIQVEGSKSNIPDLVRKLMTQVEGHLASLAQK